VLSFTAFGTPITVTLGADNLVSKVEYKTDQPVLGDTTTETTYSAYKQFGPGKFPTRIVTRQGGFPILDITVTNAEINGVVRSVPVPASVNQAYQRNPPPERNAPPPPQMVTTTKVADGVFYLTGGSHHSIAVEFADFSVLFEVPQHDARAMAVIEATRRAIPNKPLRYVVNSHNHFDHAGGVRAAMAEGITIITQAANKPYYEQVAKMPHTVNPDMLAKTPKAAVVEGVAARRVISDATNTLEIHPLTTNHSATMLVGYLPKQKILFEVDMFNAPAANAAPGPVSPNTVAFYQTLQRMGLDIQQILPGHGPGATTLADLKRVVDTKTN
jgi:glyoxylase-like metal-dependent hydrolase (beta-lactamase superfamily II)